MHCKRQLHIASADNDDDGLIATRINLQYISVKDAFIASAAQRRQCAAALDVAIALIASFPFKKMY